MLQTAAHHYVLLEGVLCHSVASSCVGKAMQKEVKTVWVFCFPSNMSFFYLTGLTVCVINSTSRVRLLSPLWALSLLARVGFRSFNTRRVGVSHSMGFYEGQGAGGRGGRS